MNGRMARICITKVLLVVSTLLLVLSMIIMPPQYNVGSEKISVDMELKAGWNLKVMPASITASDLALKSNYITNIIHRSSEGHFVSYVPSLKATDFICETDELIYIYSSTDTSIIFYIDAFGGYENGNLTVSGDLYVPGDTTLDRNLTVNGSMFVSGNMRVNSIFVTDYLTTEGYLVVNGELRVGDDLTVYDNLTVERDMRVTGNILVQKELIAKEDLHAEKDLIVEESLLVGNNLVVNENLTVGKDLIVGNITIKEDINYGGNLTVANDLLVDGNVTVNGYMDIGGDFSVAGDIIGSTGRTVTYVVAANNAPQIMKNQADFICDGTNDEEEIQNALYLCSYGVGRVYLTDGTFFIANTLDIPFGVTLEGAGMGRSVVGTELNWVGGSNDVIVYNLAGETQGNHRRGNGIYRLTVDGNNACNAGIRVKNSFHHEISQVTVKNAGGKGIIIEASFGENINGCIITHCGDDGIYLTDYGGYPCTFIKIEGCEIGTNTNYNIRILSGERVSITKCWLENSMGSGSTTTHLYMNDMSVYDVQVRVSDCSFNNLRNGMNSIILEGGMLFLNHNSIWVGDIDKKGVTMTGGYLQMEGNDIFIPNNGGFGRGVKITGSKYALIKGNSFLGNSLSGYAIEVQGVNVFDVDIDGNLFCGGGIYIAQIGVTIKNNQFDDIATPYGIYTSGNYILVENNHLYDLSGTGIYIGEPYCEIIGNMVYRSGINIDNFYDAIHVDGSYCIVDNNMVFSNNGNKSRYGIFVEDEYFVSISNNFVHGTVTWDIYLENGGNNLVEGNICPDGRLSLPDSPGDIYRNNIGYITENSGSATVTDGTWISHGLNATPEIVILTPRSNVNVWVISRNDNQFQVGVSSGTVTVDWYAKV